MLVGDRIKFLREGLKQSQEELASAIGMHSNTVARWERGELAPRGTSLLKLAQALKTSTAYLLSETDDPIRADASSAQGDKTHSFANTPQTQAGQDLDALVKELASKNPDLVIHLRSTAQNLRKLSDEIKQVIADGLKYVLGLAALDDLPRLKKDDGRGRI
nr:helix-turn-helix domain-containing protein [uncultured Fretibacterium sp.]